MTPRTMQWNVGIVATLLLLGVALTQTPEYQLWQWTQRYDSTVYAKERLKTNPDDVKAHRTLACQVLRSDSKADIQQARHEWEEVLRCDPSDQFAVIVYAPILIAGSSQERERARVLLTPIAEHGNKRLRDEAKHMLRDIGAPAT